MPRFGPVLSSLKRNGLLCLTECIVALSADLCFGLLQLTIDLDSARRELTVSVSQCEMLSKSSDMSILTLKGELESRDRQQKADIDELLAQVVQKENALGALNVTVGSLQRELDAARQRETEAASTHNASVKALQDAFGTSVANKEAELIKATEKFEAAQAAWKAERTRKDAELQATQSVLDGTKQELRNTKASLASLQDDLEAKRASVAQLKASFDAQLSAAKREGAER